MTSPSRVQKIPYQGILRAAIGDAAFVDLYRQRVLTQNTRTIPLLGRKSSARIINTLLGYEVQASYKRIQCPDMVTARYLRLFSELGCHSIKLPYDPTLTAQVIPEFEAMLHALVRRIRELFPRDLRKQRLVIRRVYAIIRHQLKNA
ncbi:MAG: hypothetical protein JXA73_02805 [Acidobacteria bacterium]|nr:hypothetical protein [Acidobacteriota bacterium]